MSVRYRNPVLPGFHPDPSICRVGEDYYLATSSFEYFPGVPLFHSRDLVNWSPVGHALTRSSQLDLTGAACSEGIFAPTLRWHQGRFYLVTTNVRAGGGNFYVCADDIRGPWSDPVWLDAGGFDPSLFFDEDGRCYYTRRDGHAIVQAELDIDSGRLTAPGREIARPFVSLDGEGPHLYKAAGQYYLLTAEGGTGFGHMVCVGRSRSPWGPFDPCPGNPILSHARETSTRIRYTGHGDLVEAGDGAWWMVFLATRHAPQSGACFHHMGRETFLAPVEWIDGWPVVNGGRLIELEMCVARLPGGADGSHALAARENCEFGESWPGPEWQFLRNPLPGAWSVTERPGALRLWGNAASLDDDAAPAFAGRRLDSPGFRAEVMLQFSPRRRGEEAGLTFLLSNSFHAEVGLRYSSQGEGVELFVRQRVAHLCSDLAVLPWAESQVALCISGDWAGITFAAGAARNSLRELARSDRRFFSSEVAGGWTGSFLGMVASGRGSACSVPADFSDWCYTREPLQEPAAYPEQPFL